MAEPIESYAHYATHPSIDGPAELKAKIFRPADQSGPLPLLVWFHSGGFHSGSIENSAHKRLALRFVDRGIICAFVEYRLRVRAEDLSKKCRAKLPELFADAVENVPEIRPNMVGERALGALEDGAAFLNWAAANAEEQQFSGRFLLGGSSAGGLTALNLLNLAPHLDIDIPEISSAFVMSGGFAYPNFTSNSKTPVLAIHGTREWQIPVTTIRAYAEDPDNNCVLLEDMHHTHGDLRVNGDEPLWRAIDRIVAFDKGEAPAPARTAPEGEAVKEKHRICLYTCVKNEGPFLLEWIAHNRAIGVTDFIIFSNDCTDGTFELLEHLDALGIVNHIPNPSTRLKSREHLRLTVACAPYHRAFFRSDYVILSDVDEFIQVNVKGGTLDDLIAATGYPDVLSLSELLYGFGGIEQYEDKLVTENFHVAQTENPPEETARRGIKSIMKFTPLIWEYSNHRPLVKAENVDKIFWMNGAGVHRRKVEIARGQRGHDVRGTYRLARVNHYTLRSGESMLVKFQRGDAVRPGRMRPDYFSHRNACDTIDHSFDHHLPGLKAELQKLMADEKTAALHQQCVEKHKLIVKVLRENEKLAEVWKAIQEEVARSTQVLNVPDAAE